MNKYKQRSHEQLSRAVNKSIFIWITITQDSPISDFEWKTLSLTTYKLHTLFP